MASFLNTLSGRSRTALIWQWIAWVIVISMGWGIAAVTMAVASFSAGIYDPDEVEAFQRMSSSGRLVSAIIAGIFIGLIVGVPLGLYQWLREKRGPRQALITAGIAVVLGVLVCAFGSPGPTEVVGARAVNVSTGFEGGFLGGAWVGLLQYVLLRRRVSGYWVPVTVVTWALAWAGFMATPSQAFSTSPPYESLWMSIVISLCGGALIGLAQWPFLRPAYGRAAWWIPASALGWLLTNWLTNWIGVLGVLAVGIITATTLMALPLTQDEVQAEQSLDKPAA